jgi:hypothetical protein
MTANIYNKVKKMNNGIKVLEMCEKAVINSNSYKEALAQVEGIILAAWGNDHEEKAGKLCYSIWMTYMPATI